MRIFILLTLMLIINFSKTTHALCEDEIGNKEEFIRKSSEKEIKPGFEYYCIFYDYHSDIMKLTDDNNKFWESNGVVDGEGYITFEDSGILFSHEKYLETKKHSLYFYFEIEQISESESVINNTYFD